MSSVLTCDICGTTIDPTEVRVSVIVNTSGPGWSASTLRDRHLDLHVICYTEHLEPAIVEVIES